MEILYIDQSTSVNGLVYNTSCKKRLIYISALMIDPDLIDRGLRLSMAIQASGISQDALAAQLGLTKQGLSHIVKGHSPGLKHLGRLATALGVTDDWIQRGGTLPPSLAKALALPTPAAVFTDILARCQARCSALRNQDPGAFDQLIARAPLSMRKPLRTHEQPSPPGAPAADYLALCALVGIQLDDLQRESFIAGHALYAIAQAGMRRDFNDGKPAAATADLALDPDVFATVRGALQVVLAERQAFKKPTDDVDHALSVLWQRQLSHAWDGPEHAELERQRAHDLGLTAVAAAEAIVSSASAPPDVHPDRTPLGGADAPARSQGATKPI